MFADHDLHPLSPPEDESTKPWMRGAPACKGNWSEVLKQTCDSIQRLENTATHSGNRLFLSRLGKDIRTEDMKLPAFPQSAKMVHHLLKRDIADAFKFAKLLATDPALEHAVWYQANSVQYSRPASSLRGAIARLSQNKMWRLITRVGIESAVWHVPHMEHWVNQQRLHSVVVAELTTHLSTSEFGPEYMAGLLHGIGRLSVYRAAVRHRRSPAPQAVFVAQISDQFYTSIGALIARSWNLDPAVTAAIAHHNTPNRANTEGQHTAWMVHLANIIAHTAIAEAMGIDIDGREHLEQLKGIQFDVENAFDLAHDVISETEAFHAAQEADADEQSA